MEPLGCREALGMESGAIPDGQISASSEWNAAHGAIRGRLHLQAGEGKKGSWSTAVKDANQWIQVDLGNYSTTVTQVATQGSRNGFDSSQWVTKYKLQYSDDEVNFQYYKEQGQNEDKVRYIKPALFSLTNYM